MSTIGANKLKQVSGGSTEFEVGNIVIYKDATENNSGAVTSFVKLKEAQTGKGGELRIKFDMKSNIDTHTVQGRIYRNGVAVGTTRSQTSTSFITYSEDISGWSSGDLIQIYGKGDNQASATIKNFNIYVDKSETII